MPSLDTIRNITIKATTEGVDPATQALNKLSAANENLSVVSEKSSKSTLSAQAALDRQSRSLDTTYRSNQQYNKAVSDLERAHAQGLTTLDRHNQLMGLAATKYGQGSVTSQAFGKAIGGVQGQMVALSAGMGPVGVFLAGLGPVGMVAAVGLGAVEAAFSRMSQMAHDLAQHGRELRDFSESTGLAINQLGALNRAGADVGLTSDRVALGIERFTVALNDIQRGTGQAYEKLLQFNPELARQLATSRGTADALNILSRAYENLDLVQRNSLSRAVFGRTGMDFGRLLGAVNTAGGIGGLATNNIDEEKLRRIAQLAIDIEERAKRARTALALIWSEEVLASEARAAEVMERMARRMQEMKEATQGNWFQNWFIQMGQVLGGQQMVGARPQLGETPSSPVGPQRTSTAAFRNILAMPRTATEPPPDPHAAERAFNDMNRWMSLLGPAASSTEHLALQQARLSAENEKLGNRYGGLVSRAMEYYRVQQSGADLQVRIAAGIATETQLRTQHEAELDQQLKRLNLSDAERARIIGANAVATQKYIEATRQRMEVERAALPGLKQLELESANFRTQLDTLSTTSLNNLTSNLADITMGTVTAQQGFRNLGLQVIRSLDEMLIKMLIVAPIARSLQASLGGFGILDFLGLGTGTSTGKLGTVSALGNVFDQGRLIPFAGGGVIDRPIIFPMATGAGLAGEAGPEAIMPLKRGRDGKLGISGSGGDTTTITLAPTIVIQGGNTQADQVQADMVAKAATAQMRAMIHEEIRQQKRPRGLLN